MNLFIELIKQENVQPKPSESNPETSENIQQIESTSIPTTSSSIPINQPVKR